MLPITARVAWITPSTLTWRMRATCSRSYVSSVPCQLTPVTRAASFDHLVGDQEKVASDRQPQFSCNLQVDDQFELGRLLHGQVRRLGSFQDFVHIRGSTSEQVGEVRSVGHKTAGIYELPCLIHCRQAAARREAHDLPVFAKQHWARQYDKSVSAPAGHPGKCAGEFVGGNRRYEVKLQSQGLGGSLDLLQYPRHRAFAVGTGMPERCHTRKSRNHVSQ